jgi:hypothetical protein
MTTNITTTLTLYQRLGWLWTVTEQGQQVTYRTNGDGCGLWRNRQQVKSVTEFRLPRDRAGAIKVLREMN